MVNQDTPKLQTLQIINNLDRTGELKQLVNSGVVSVKVYQHKDICNYVHAQIYAGLKKRRAILNAEDHFGLKERCIYKILKAFS